jgi:hypothetical protein
LPIWPTIKAIIKHLSVLTMAVLRSPPHKLTAKLLPHNISGRHKDIQLKDHTISMCKTNIHSMMVMGMGMRRTTTTNTSSTQVMLEEAADVANIRRRTKAILHHRTTMAIVGVEAEETRGRRVEMVVEEVPPMVDRPRQTARGADMIIGVCEADEAIRTATVDPPMVEWDEVIQIATVDLQMVGDDLQMVREDDHNR